MTRETRAASIHPPLSFGFNSGSYLSSEYGHFYMPNDSVFEGQAQFFEARETQRVGPAPFCLVFDFVIQIAVNDGHTVDDIFHSLAPVTDDGDRALIGWRVCGHAMDPAPS